MFWQQFNGVCPQLTQLPIVAMFPLKVFTTAEKGYSGARPDDNWIKGLMIILLRLAWHVFVSQRLLNPL